MGGKNLKSVNQYKRQFLSICSCTILS